MGCLVAGLLALGMLVLAYGVMMALGVVTSLAGISPPMPASSHDIPIGVLLVAVGAFFLILGIVMLRHHRATIGLDHTVGLTVFLFIVSALIVIQFVRTFNCYPKDARRSICINNLRLIDHAKEVLAIKNGWTNGQIIAATPDAIWAQLVPHMGETNLLCCPMAPRKHYIYGPIEVMPRCPVADIFTEHVYGPR